MSVPAAIQALSAEGKRAFAEGRYAEAREIYLKAARAADQARLPAQQAMYRNNAGGCSLIMRRLSDAMASFLEARDIASRSHSHDALSYTLTNLTSLYLQMLNPAAAEQSAREALAEVTDQQLLIRLRFQLASAIARQQRFSEARPQFEAAIFDIEQAGDLDTQAAFWSGYGLDALTANQLAMADTAFTEALRLSRTNRLTRNTATILRGLARVRARQGESRIAAVLFDAALREPAGISARWEMLAERGSFLLESGKPAEALRDFREARKLMAQLKADMVPADLDRVTLESGLGAVLNGLVEAGNRLSQGGDPVLLAETFDAAEQDRMWSLRALVPHADDWRARLPNEYWQVLARYQSMQRGALAAGRTVGADALRLALDMEQMESKAAGGYREASGSGSSALAHVRGLLDEHTALFSFHLAGETAWRWDVTRTSVQARSLGPAARLRGEVDEFSRAVREGRTDDPAARLLFDRLFDGAAPNTLGATRWLLEPDGALYQLPFAALRNGRGYLPEQAALQLVPGALLLSRGEVEANGTFVGIGDAIYNSADTRFKGGRGSSPALALPRLPGTARELQSCAREWAGPSTLLSGAEAGEASVAAAIETRPSILHFATHVIPAPGESGSGVIALSLDGSGIMSLLGPKQILARPVQNSLVVLNGCHSGQGEALPASGLMGLTRAWIGAGAGAVVATGWDVPDATGERIAAGFYRALRSNAAAGPAAALRSTQLAEIAAGNSGWAAYFVLGRWI